VEVEGILMMDEDIVSSPLKEGAVFYCYAIMDKSKPGVYRYEKYLFEYEPSYIGCSRASSRMSSSARNIRNRFKIETVSLKIQDKMLKEDSLYLENYLVSLIGRKCMDTGPLFNVGPGGERNPMHNREIVEKYFMGDNNVMRTFEIASAVNKKRRAHADPAKISAAVAESNRTRVCTDETRKKRSENLANRNKNRVWSEESKLRNALAKYKKYNNTLKYEETLEKLKLFEK
jgi:hypothetical protein